MSGISPNSALLAGDITARPHVEARTGRALSVSMAAHVVVFAMMIITIARMPELAQPRPDSMFLSSKDITWLAEAGLGGGGAGGGNRMPGPPRKAELPGSDKTAVPVAKTPALQNTAKPNDEPKPVQQLSIPAVAVSSGLQEVPGALTGLPSISQGPGIGGGAGTGKGPGIGPGEGAGLGPGHGPGTGGDYYHPGNGVMSPRLLLEVKPKYTADAMRAKIQGIVALEAVVMPDGSVGAVHVTRSLDDTFGLDQEALRTARQWRFQPGTLRGTPVPVLVEIEMTFALR